jgi:hypothetical protein
LNDQVLAFINVIASVLTKTGVDLHFLIHMEKLEEQQRDFVYQLVNIFREDLICVSTKLANIPLLPDMDNQKSQLNILHGHADTDIPLLMKMLATARLDGQQRVIHLVINSSRLVMKMLDAIEKVETQYFLKPKKTINNLLFRISAILRNPCHNPSTSSANAICC